MLGSQKGYYEKKIFSGDFLEIYRYSVAEYKREKVTRKELTSDKQKRMNFKNACRKLMRLMNCNFKHGEDFHVTLTFKSKSKARIDEKEARKEFKNFIKRLDRFRKANGLEKLKYIAAIGEGKSTGIHFHICVNKMDINDLLNTWKTSKEAGRINFSILEFSNQNGLASLAEYFVKQELKKEKDVKVSESASQNKKRLFKKWFGSRNLKKPRVERKVIKRLFLKEEPKRLKKYKVTYYENDYNDYTGAYQYVQMRLRE